ncbi:uncharacterized protein LOC124416464 [Diprion similis]|uniref:uncharacterized protein LOC124416464 n=1 Tax=Diprion similis TaxID=362088 RepID=UPI001EF98759|nr:uncharacterized protein LOC124416464 [Diprion similis]
MKSTVDRMNYVPFIYLCLTTIYGLSYGEKSVESKPATCELKAVFSAPEYEKYCNKDNTSVIPLSLPSLDGTKNEVIYLCTGIYFAVNKFCESHAYHLDKRDEIRLTKSYILTELTKAVNQSSERAEICSALSSTLSNSRYDNIMNYGRDNKDSSLNLTLLNETLRVKCDRLCSSVELTVSVKPLCPIILWVNRILVNSIVPTPRGIDQAGKILTSIESTNSPTSSNDKTKPSQPSGRIHSEILQTGKDQNQHENHPDQKLLTIADPKVGNKPASDAKKSISSETQREETKESNVEKTNDQSHPPKNDLPHSSSIDGKPDKVAPDSKPKEKVDQTKAIAPKNVKESTTANINSPTPHRTDKKDQPVKIPDEKPQSHEFEEVRDNEGNDGVEDRVAERTKTDGVLSLSEKDAEQGKGNNVPKPPPASTMDPPQHFFTYFMAISVTCLICYIAYHKKQKIMALLFEGRKSRGRGRRRPNTANYRKLDCTLEEAVTSQCNSNVTHVIY